MHGIATAATAAASLLAISLSANATAKCPAYLEGLPKEVCEGYAANKKGLHTRAVRLYTVVLGHDWSTLTRLLKRPGGWHCANSNRTK